MKDKFVWSKEDKVGIRKSSILDPQDPKRKRFLIKHIFFGDEDLYKIYLGFFIKAVLNDSSTPHEEAMIEFRKYFDETPTRWVRKKGVTLPRLQT